MTNKIQDDQRLIDVIKELQELDKNTLKYAQSVRQNAYEVVEDSENLTFNNNKDE